ncbi:retron Ec48 family effector membrane protein [Marinobacter zhanjiangensis]|uniref:Phage abortive infection protein n=1 Tax=Marinobacter zhanjiangensis TaxID=578215 RepID=A0ABQ3AWJ2_9GAMM|nr:retron Ec48 family effector membrane protein [Marinobacter zhanjiangensis]GGY68754.1 hypothetical protein GCM10007071_14510 [Marinobacter zhanjiangensis]
MNRYVWPVLGIFIITLIGAAWSFVNTYNQHDLGFDDLCFLSNCVTSFREKFSGTIEILGFGSSVAYIVIFASGVYIALNNYLTSVKSSALSGHIGHLTMFKDYMVDELKKYGALKSQKVNVYRWYRLAFPLSSKGDITVSEEYKLAVRGLCHAIQITNKSINSPKGGYGYRKHQDRMIEALKPFGIEMTNLPRNNFNDVEFEIFGLIDSFNHTFTDIDCFLQDCVREYV